MSRLCVAIAMLPACAAIRLPFFSPVERSRQQLKAGIAGFYDQSSGIWESVWGEHMHHGYYGREGFERKDHQQAQIDMVDESLAWAGVDAGATKAVLDVGCGIGGSSRHIARKYGSGGVGITLSPVQAARAQVLSDAQGLGGRLKFEVADALAMPFADNSFDLVWSMESGEHMPDKRQFVSELTRVCKPGGRVLVVAWCHRDLNPGEAALSDSEERLLGRINRAYFLPRWCSAADYRKLFGEFGMAGIDSDDWTMAVRRFWPAVIASALRPRNLWGLLRSGLQTLRGALVMPLMISGQKKGTIKFVLVSATKPMGAATASTGPRMSASSERGPAAAPKRPSPAKVTFVRPKPVAATPKHVEHEAQAAPPPGFEWGGTY